MSKRSVVFLCCGIVFSILCVSVLFYRIVRGPLAATADVAAEAVVPVPQEPKVTLVFTGDLMQHLPQVDAARRRDGSFDYTSCFSRLRNFFESADFVVVNLETTLGEAPYSGYPRFRSPEILAGALRRAGADAVVLANNHICDRGAEGIRTTLGALEKAGLRHTGAFADTAASVVRAPMWFEKNGVRIALFNYTYGTNGLPVPSAMTVGRIDTLRSATDIAQARRAGATHVVLFVHWGNEYQTLPDRHQRALADCFHRQGADLVIGSHPHVVQPAETVCDSAGNVCGVTVFSMGNFVSNQRFPGTDGGISVRVTLGRDARGGTTYRPEYLIHRTCILPDGGSLSGKRYDIVPSYARETIPADCRAEFDRFVRRTREHMDKHSRGFSEIEHDYR